MIQLDPDRKGETVEVTVTFKVKATVPYYLEKQGTLRSNLPFHLKGMLNELVSNGSNVEVEANEIKIGETVVSELV